MDSKVLVNVPNLSFPGGVSAVFQTLDLETAGIADYFCIHDGSKEKRLVPKYFRLIKKFFLYFHLINKYNDVILNPSLDKKSFFRDGMFVFIALIKRKQVVVFWHGWEDVFEIKIKKSWLLRSYFKYSFARADRFIILGHIFKVKLLALGVREKKIFFPFFNVADDFFIHEFNINDRFILSNKFNILFLSRIEGGKGTYLAVDIFQNLQVQCPGKDLQLIIAGDGSDLENVKTYVRSKGISDVVFTGFVTGRTKHELYRAAQLYLFPTEGEGLPLSVLEAMLYGMPIISRPVGGLPDIIKNDINGYLVDSSDPLEFVPFIKALLLDSELYQLICIENHDFAINNFVAAKARERFSNFLHTI